jgi:hypothetical protein
MIRATNGVRRGIATAALILAACGGGHGSGPGLPRGTLVIGAASGEVRVRVEIAETQEDRSRGLMGRTALAADAGMVFLEDHPTRLGFTMRGTLVPLSLGVWDAGGRILAILDMTPCRGEPCPTYDPGVAWTGALEVNRGFFAQHDIEVGDPVRLERLVR